MIKRIVSINFKVNNEALRILILFVVGILITNLHYGLMGIDNNTLLMGDVIIETYGGLVTEYSIYNIFYFILWITPYIIVLNLLNLSTIDRFRESTTLVLPRVKKKSKWFIAFNLTIIIRISIYFFTLFLSSLVVVLIKSGYVAFQNSPVHINSVININQYGISLYIILLNILTVVAIQLFLNNLYSIFSRSNEASVIGILFYIAPIFYPKKTEFCKMFLVNNGMLKRYEMFENGFNGLNFKSSLIFIIAFIIINFLIGLFIIKKQDIVDI
ncbi:hypothetical protein [Clostridium septicum]|uniref:Uncharacterized protein n=1 Tax=Clostridium septicum TaxID=1504 RepID=A0A9N7PJ85_CLOSE|nr:hypothetical protein [Clostridium septicum]AYE34455.1 hypothetical protein CP523_08440 [Clostridium septicum]MDU1312467.1 hypothetical protein [Clostridium septicum]QAS59858.1 hypothetical protein EI377_03185 [Clostridium septicum]UEC20903.1 hypothetical protein LK444_00320 [Clostridium septicum]USS01046.1 hypothetical protein NH397_00775 [Clostridium septicum]